MTINMHENLVRIKAVSEVLIGLKQEFVFVGGATVSLYNGNPEIVSDIRPTEDVDVIIELATYGGYADIDEKLRALGFKNDIASGVICRYQIQGIIVDIMPTEPKVIGFSNKWYPEGFANAIDFRLDRESTIRIFSLPYFMASKWEAFKGRGLICVTHDQSALSRFDRVITLSEGRIISQGQTNIAQISELAGAPQTL